LPSARIPARAMLAKAPCSTFILFSFLMWVLLLEGRDDESVERCLGVGFGPEADLACLLERPVLGCEVLLAVEIAFNLVPVHLDGQRVPLADLHRDPFLGRKLESLPGDDLVETVVVLQRIEASDVVIVGVLVTPDDAAALVLLARAGLERHGHFHILGARAI